MANSLFMVESPPFLDLHSEAKMATCTLQDLCGGSYFDLSMMTDKPFPSMIRLVKRLKDRNLIVANDRANLRLVIDQMSCCD